VTKTEPYDHVTLAAIEEIIPKFVGDIQQVPPIFSALSKNGKRLYQEAREGKTAEDVGLEAREVTVHKLELLNTDHKGQGLPCFGLKVECGGGVYIRSLVRDIGYDLSTVATMSQLRRTKQGMFTIEHALKKPEWSADAIYDAMERTSSMIENVERAT